MRKYSTVWPSAKLFGGMMQVSVLRSTKLVGREVLRIDHRGIDVGEDLELVRHARVVAVGRQAVADHALALLRLDERLDHAVVLRHAADPAIGHHGHQAAPGGKQSVRVIPGGSSSIGPSRTIRVRMMPSVAALVMNDRAVLGPDDQVVPHATAAGSSPPAWRRHRGRLVDGDSTSTTMIGSLSLTAPGGSGAPQRTRASGS